MIGKPHHIKFEYKGKAFTFEITPQRENEWTSVSKHRMTFDIHYCEDYNHIVVYRVRYNKADYKTTIHSQPIFKKANYHERNNNQPPRASI